MGTGQCLALFLGIVMLGLSVEHMTQPDDLQQQQDLYCEMVAIHKDTGGQYGWPDYKHIAQEACQ